MFENGLVTYEENNVRYLTQLSNTNKGYRNRGEVCMQTAQQKIL